MSTRWTAEGLALVLVASLTLTVGQVISPPSAAGAALPGALHTTGTDSRIYDSAGAPVRLVGFNWTGTELGGRADTRKTADACGVTWRTPTDPVGSVAFADVFSRMRDWGYNTVRIPVSWNNLEPVAPVWDAVAGTYVHTWSTAYLGDLRSMVVSARSSGIMVVLDMHQDYWSPALHHITNWDGSTGYCEGAGMPRWLEPTADAKAATTQNTDFYGGMNRFYRNVPDPASTLTHATPWQLLYSAWDQLAYQLSAASGFAAADAVVGADILNEPYVSYVGGSPPAGQTVLQAAGSRLRTFYEALAPAVTHWAPSWLLFFQDSTGGYNTAAPASRETPTMTGRPGVAGNWVYSAHVYAFSYGTFSDGTARHDDFGITVANALLANAAAWKVPLYIGEFTTFSLGIDAQQLTDADMAQTRQFLSWAKQNGVSWTFWAYANGYRPMTVVDVGTNQPVAVVANALATGLDGGVPPPTNQPPVARMTSSCTALACTFDGRASTDPDGSVTAWAWSFGDTATGGGATASHTYSAAGTYPVTLAVTDDDGASSTVAAAVTVTAPGTAYAADTFSRMVTAGWGSAELGGPWTTSSPSSRLAVAGGVGTLRLMGPGSGVSTFLGTAGTTSTDVQVTCAIDRAATGGGVYLSLIARRVPGAGDYRAKVRLLATGTVALSLVRTTASGSETAIRSESVVTGLRASASTRLRIRLQVVGATPAVVRATVWLASGSEPTAWTATTTDTTPALQVRGGVGVMAYLSGSATNAPVTAQLDDLVASVAP